MTTINISLPDALESFAATRVAAGDYASVQDFILALLEQARLDEERRRLEAKLVEGVAALDRGEGRPMTAGDWDRLRTTLRDTHSAGEHA
jgi:Arc/MetJ-type ribon-helix-helix transcriptional regulator